MKLTLKIVSCCFVFCASHSLLGQENTLSSKGKVTGKVFFNYHANTTSGVAQKSAFQLTRAYVGYTYNINKQFSTTVLLDAGKSAGGSDHSVFIKNAKITYKASEKITLSAGIFGMKQFKEQEKFWSYRYLYKSFNDEYKFGTSADAGVMAAIKLSSQFKIDLLFVNGEGYKKAQDINGSTRIGANFVYKPSKNWTLKAYVDTMKGTDIVDITKETTMTNSAFFIGYTIENLFRIGAEYNTMQNGVSYKKPVAGINLQGVSVYATYIINKKWNVFGRFDQLTSDAQIGQLTNWNHFTSGNKTVIGFEYQPIKEVKIALNYRQADFIDFINRNDNNKSSIYANLGFFF